MSRLKAGYLLICLSILAPLSGSGQGDIWLDNQQQTVSISERVRSLNLMAAEMLPDDPEQSMGFAQKAYVLAKNSADTSAWFDALNNLGYAYRYLGQYERSLSYFTKAYELIRYTEDNNLKAKVCNRLGITYQSLGKLPESLKHFEFALSYYDQCDDLSGMADIYNNIGNVYRKWHQYNRSMEYQVKHYLIREKMKDKHGMSTALTSIGNIYFEAGSYKMALACQFKALTLKKETGNLDGVAETYLSIGKTYGKMGEADKAIPYLQQALELNEALGMQTNNAWTCLAIAENYILLNEYKKSLRFLERAREQFENAGMLYASAQLYLVEGKALAGLEKYQSSERALVKSYELATESNSLEIQSEASKALGDLYEKDEAYYLALKYFKIYDEVSSKIEEERIAQLFPAENILKPLNGTDPLVDALSGEERSNNLFWTRWVWVLSISLLVAASMMMVYRLRYRSLRLLELKNQRIQESKNKLQEEVEQRALELEVEIEERKKVELKLKESLKKSEQSSHLKDAFLNNISHEIRTPLNSIIGFSDLLKEALEESDNDDFKSYADCINESGNRLLNLLTHIIDISRIQADDLEVSLTPCSVKRVMHEASTFFTFKANEKGLTFEQKPGDHPDILADQTWLIKVIVDIIDNAIKYTEKGSIKLLSRMVPESNEVLIQVADTGVGIDPDYLPHIFEAFTQESTGFTRTYEGAGLGLPLAKRLIDLMNGRLEVESTKGKGTTVNIYLPPSTEAAINDLPDVELPQIQKEVEKTATQETAPKDNPSRSINPEVRILIIEDDPIGAKFLKILLQKFGKVSIALDGDDAIRHIRENALDGLMFDMIFMDINLPYPWDGISLLEEIRNRWQDYKNVPIIAQTAYAMMGDRERLLKEGFNDYVSKPIDEQPLLEMAAMHLSKVK